MVFFMLVGETWYCRQEKQEKKAWSLWMYGDEKGRRRGVRNQMHHRQGLTGLDIICFEVTLKDMIEKGRLVPVVPLPEGVVDDVKLEEIGRRIRGTSG
jgi:hypothetical protein